MNRVVHFDILADDPERAANFYESAFGWKFKKWEGENMTYWLITTGPDSEPGINGGMGLRKDIKDAQFGHNNTIGTENIDESIRKVEQSGGTLEMQKVALPKVGWFASFKDTEGNRFSLMQSDMNAK